MTVKWVTGTLGAGKGLYCDHEMRKYYREGRRVVTNYPVDTRLLDSDSVNPVTVIPDHPRAEDLQALGRGCSDDEKEKFGAIFLDEAGTWLNSRTYADKGRLALINWFIHSRHLGWDVFIIVQNEDMIDKQICIACGEVLVVCERSDRTVGIFRKLLKKLISGKSSDGSVQQKKQSGLYRHRVIVKTYFNRKSLRDKPFEKFSFFADWYFGIHDTNYIFHDGFEALTYPDGAVKIIDMRCTYSLLPGKIIKEWYHANDSVAKQPPISKGRLFTILFFGTGTFLSWYFLVSNKQPDIEASAESQQSSSSSQSNIANSGAAGSIPQPAPSPPRLSPTWRLTGYLNSGKGKPRYVIRDNTGNVRYIESTQKWDGVYSEIIVDGERITFWTGSERTQSNQAGSENPLSTAATPVFNALGMGDVSH
ncbi:hypothetical protein G3G77_004773 [Salmonella enterica]|nr:hypothetical protein [Salmonella enterica]EEH5466705.1 hypothetical protein [Salmonella enterica]EEH7556025.1 hypothetical protein [Salmonella enterica]EEO5640222.1 hypothetical protein [Salmonella enterica]EEQ0204194.1 hypothetical protein [Salmonella enterica]